MYLSDVLLVDIDARKSLQLFLAVFLFLNFSCKPAQEDTPTSIPTLFRALSPTNTGIDFANLIRENERTNFLTYPYMYNGGGVAVGDLDNDGLPDIYFTGNMEGDRLYHNQGSLKFKDITRQAGILSQNLWTTGVTMADVNDDGLLDIYVCRSGDRGFRNNLLYINQGDMKFKEEARNWGINDNGYSTQATFFDYDLDGDLDLYLVNHSIRFNFNQEEIFKNKFSPLPEESDQLFRNEGDHFTNVSQEAGIQHFAFGLSATAADLNSDGYPDIYAGSDFFEPDFLYINQQDGTFRDVLPQSTRHISFSSMGADIADYNNDGLPDIFVADMRAADHYRYQANMVGMNRHKFSRMLAEDYHYQYMQNTLQLHQGYDVQGLPLFSEVGQLAGVSSTDWSWSALFFDMDNDGWKDLFVSNGIARDIQNKDAWTRINESRQKRPAFSEMLSFFPEAPLHNYTYHNAGDLSFEDVSSSFGIDYQGASNGVAYADLDNDGDLDLVMNNLNAQASVYENVAGQQTNKHFLQIRFRGREDNHFGLGARVNIRYQDQQQYQELSLSRGFQSSVPPILHFGTDSLKQVDEVEVFWPNGKQQTLKNVTTDQLLLIDQKDAKMPDKDNKSPVSQARLQQLDLVEILHQEEAFDDFAREPLLSYKLSSNGPVIAIADVNNDRLEDFYFGGSKGFSGKLYLQNSDGTFSSREQAVWKVDRVNEDTDALFFDADQDGDMDLYVASGSNEFETASPHLKDRLYLNDGKGNFSSAKLPDLPQNNSCIASADFDQDGDLDLFVGGASVPGAYPQAENAYLLINEGGIFSQQELGIKGLITDAVWADIDQDKDEDLLIIGHWMTPLLLENQNGSLQPARDLDFVDYAQKLSMSGLWNSILAQDVDQDGKIDLVLGNEGLNSPYSASSSHPLEMMAADFDNNGSLDALMAYYQDDNSYPVQGRDKILRRVPSWQRKFPDYHSFASMTMEQILADETSDSLLHLEVNQLASCILFNEGNGTFNLQLLPTQAQISAVQAINAADLNQDGFDDLILAGNHHDREVETSRNDAGIGLILLSTGKRGFRPLSLSESGFLAHGEVRDMELLKTAGNSTLLLVGRNQDSLKVYRLPAMAEKQAWVE
ncbi:VCBS repeat-containing protein [Catalinimonas sp. 4WD22]|uniref:VCBS repeat-containing protein n=1 Tax=Catalinimonas locisalis TaxID=3133978 RepID=UPI0031010627